MKFQNVDQGGRGGVAQNMFFFINPSLTNRPAVAWAVLQTPLKLNKSVTPGFNFCLFVRLFSALFFSWS